MEDPYPVENIDRLGVLMFQTSDNSQLLRRVLWINAKLTIETNEKKKLHVIPLWWLCITFVWPRGPKKLPTTAPSSNQNAIGRYFTLLRLCLGLLFFISIVSSLKHKNTQPIYIPIEKIPRILNHKMVQGGDLIS